MPQYLGIWLRVVSPHDLSRYHPYSPYGHHVGEGKRFEGEIRSLLLNILPLGCLVDIPVEETIEYTSLEFSGERSGLEIRFQKSLGFKSLPARRLDKITRRVSVDRKGKRQMNSFKGGKQLRRSYYT